MWIWEGRYEVWGSQPRWLRKYSLILQKNVLLEFFFYIYIYSEGLTCARCVAWLPNGKLTLALARVSLNASRRLSLLPDPSRLKNCQKFSPTRKKKPGKVSEKDLFKGNFYFFKKKRCIGATVSVICLSCSVVLLQFVYINRFPLFREMHFSTLKFISSP